MGGSLEGTSGTGGNVTAGADTDLDNNEAYTSGLPAGYGLVLVANKTDAKDGLFRLENTTTFVVSADATFSVTKDNAATINVYVEGGYVIVQNKIANNKSITVGSVTI